MSSSRIEGQRIAIIARKEDGTGDLRRHLQKPAVQSNKLKIISFLFLARSWAH
jgi:hypothetical protein